MQNYLIPTTEEWIVLDRALSYFQCELELELIQHPLDQEVKKVYEIVKKYLNIINKRDILNDKY